MQGYLFFNSSRQEPKKKANLYLVKVSTTPVHIKVKKTQQPTNLLATHEKRYNVEYQRRCYRSYAALPSLP
jgi:hypothetical protein